MKIDVKWNWSSAQEDAFSKIKNMIIEHNKLAIFNPNAEVTLQNDSSQFGLGSTLMQNNIPVAYASRKLTDAETRYA